MKQFGLTFLLTVLMSMVGAKASAYDIAVENADGVTIYYNYIAEGLELEVTNGRNNYYSFYDYYKGNVVIPEEVTYMNRTRKVTAIGKEAFRDGSLNSITIPNSVTTIGESAFRDCRTLPSVTIPNSVTTIGKAVFAGCLNLATVTIPNSVTTIGEWAFDRCALISVEIPNSVTAIGCGAFSGCDLTSVTIPSSVSSIEDQTFQNNNLTSVTIPNSVKSIGDEAFYLCDKLTSVSIPNSVTTIGNYTFYRCSGLTSVTIPNSVKSIGNRAFDCDNLATVVSLIENPVAIETAFSKNTLMNATLYVPFGKKEAYKSTEGWKDFVFIEEVATDDVASVSAQEILIQSEAGLLTVEGVEDGTEVSVYDVNGTQPGSAISRNGRAVINTKQKAGSVAIVKIGNRSVKVILK